MRYLIIVVNTDEKPDRCVEFAHEIDSPSITDMPVIASKRILEEYDLGEGAEDMLRDTVMFNAFQQVDETLNTGWRHVGVYTLETT